MELVKYKTDIVILTNNGVGQVQDRHICFTGIEYGHDRDKVI